VSGHFECIGVADEDEFAALAEAAIQDGEATPINGAREIVWRDAEGASLAVTVGADKELLCARPTFAATSRVNARVGALAEDPECAFCSRLLLEVVDDAGELVYPLAVELERHAPARDPSVAGRQLQLPITAFAETIETWPSEDAYEAAHPGRMLGDEAAAGDPALAAQSLIPTGLFVDQPKRPFWRRKAADPVPTAHALITGVVRALEARKNSFTGRDFMWLALETYGASYDVVVAPADASDALSEGAVVQGSFWFVAALPDRP
jgi:hypothetical protein